MMELECQIRRERPEDYFETENVVREAFWNVYHPGCTEHYLLHCFRSRSEFIPELDLVLVKDGRIIGQVMYVHSQVDGDGGTKIPTFTFGPIGIHPDYQRQGYGRKLLEASMQAAAALGAGALVITGNILFYGPSGFVPARTRGIRLSRRPGSRLPAG